MIVTSLRARIRPLGSESGIALPVSITVLMISGLLAGAAATSALTANSQSSRDKGVKRAVAAADAGLDVGKYRLNKFATVLTATNQCVSRNTTTGTLYTEAVQSDGWCRAQTEDLGDGASFSYRVSGRQQVNVGGQNVWQRKLVATGLVNGVQRRVATSVSAATGNPLFSEGVFSDLDLDMRNSAQINATARSNGNVNLQNSASICGDVKVGPGKKLTGSKNCSTGTTGQATEPFVLSPVTIPTPDDNYRITAGAPGPDDPRTGTIGWTNRQLTLDHDTLTLNGSAYVLCNLTIAGQGELIIPNDGTPVRIYIESPDRCGGAGTGNFKITTSSSEITNLSGDPSMLQLYVAGSKFIPTTVEFSNSHDVQMTVYAPNSSAIFENNTRLVGAVAAKKVTMRNSARIDWDARAGNVQTGTTTPLQIYRRQSWTECNAQGGSAPDSGC